MNRLLSIPLAVSLSFAMPVSAAFAVTAYDARTLGMGGSSVGYSDNASLAYWNPAAVAMDRTWGVYLPSIGVSFSNNLLSPSDAQALASGLGNLGQASGTGSAGSTDFTQIFNKLGSPGGLNLQAEAIFEPIGISLGKVGPGSMAFRLYGHALANAKVSLSSDFATNLNGLFFQGGFTNITTAISNLTKEASNPVSTDQATLNADVKALQTQLRGNMSSFIKTNGAPATVKSLSVDETVGVDAAAAFTYAQVVPWRLTMFPKSEITVGATAKIFGSPGSMLANIQPLQLQGGVGGEKISPFGGGAGASVNLNIDKQVTNLSNAIDAYSAPGGDNLKNISDMVTAGSDFVNSGLANSTVQLSSTTPDNVGLGFDLGTAMKIDDQWSVGLSLINPVLLWNATKTTYKYDLSGDSIKLVKVGADQRTSFSAAEPFVARAGAAYQPDLPGPKWLSKGLLVNAGVEAPINNGVPASIQLGVEKVFGGVFALRLGTSQLGLSPLYTAGLGVQSRFFQLNVGGGVDSPTSNIKAAAFAVTIGAGF